MEKTVFHNEFEDSLVLLEEGQRFEATILHGEHPQFVLATFPSEQQDPEIAPQQKIIVSLLCKDALRDFLVSGH